jgi:hypothetical protein
MIEEESFIKEPDLLERFSSDHDACTRCPLHFLRFGGFDGYRRHF